MKCAGRWKHGKRTVCNAVATRYAWAITESGPGLPPVAMCQHCFDLEKRTERRIYGAIHPANNGPESYVSNGKPTREQIRGNTLL